MQCRAEENSVYFVSVNRAMQRQNSASSVIDPKGDLIEFIPRGEEKLLVVDLDLTKATGLYASRFQPALYQEQAVAADTPKPLTGGAPSEVNSHPTVRELPPLTDRPLDEGPAYFVDQRSGSDDGPGAKERPWATINHALKQLKAGDTLYLRAGSYFENVYCAVAGTAEKPITIRAYPGERVVLDGSLSEFQQEPTAAWKPFEGGAKDEFVSTRTFRNMRDVLGLFGDSNVGLQTYWHASDLRASNEMWIVDKETKAVDPVYCGPGLWYDKQSGRIHARVASNPGHPRILDYQERQIKQ